MQKEIIFLFAVLAFCISCLFPDLPRVYVIGDSISIQYHKYLEKFLQGKVALDRKRDNGEALENLDIPKGANGGDSRMVLEYFKIKTKERNFKPDYLLLNCGLHDIKTKITTNTRQVSEVDYRKNLSELIALAKANEIKIIWIRTTPVVDSIHNHTKNKWRHRFSKDVTAYNSIADSLFSANHIPIIDLHSFTQSLGSEHFIDHVHYDEATRRLQAAYIAGYLLAYLEKEH